MSFRINFKTFRERLSTALVCQKLFSCNQIVFLLLSGSHTFCGMQTNQSNEAIHSVLNVLYKLHFSSPEYSWKGSVTMIIKHASLCLACMMLNLSFRYRQHGYNRKNMNKKQSVVYFNYLILLNSKDTNSYSRRKPSNSIPSRS